MPATAFPSRILRSTCPDTRREILKFTEIVSGTERAEGRASVHNGTNCQSSGEIMRRARAARTPESVTRNSLRRECSKLYWDQHCGWVGLPKFIREVLINVRLDGRSGAGRSRRQNNAFLAEHRGAMHCGSGRTDLFDGGKVHPSPPALWL